MSKITKEAPPYYVKQETDLTDDRIRILNYSDTFAVLDRWGDINPVSQQAQGLYHEGTRFLSRLNLLLFDQQPSLLNSTITDKNEVMIADLTNHEIYLDDRVIMAEGKVHIQRKKFLQNGVCYERIRLTNYSKWDIDLKLTFAIESDFRDIFDIRGYPRPETGKTGLGRNGQNGRIIYDYQGLDKIERSAELNFNPAPDETEDNKLHYYIYLDSKQRFNIEFTVSCNVGRKKNTVLAFSEAYERLDPAYDEAIKNIAKIHSSNEHFNHWVRRSEADLIALTASTELGMYPYAGVPWFNTAFGRDGIITAYEVLWLNPEIARGVLSFLASHQATEHDDFKDAEPGKILHETRGGEMAELGEVPFKQYYGTVDATPLFIVLAGAYYKRTADLDFIRKIWPNIKAALEWIDRYGDLDNDGFVEYASRSPGGLINHGWKDADNAINDENGDLAEPPIALCEVQGYVYDAKIKAAMLAARLSEKAMTERLLKEARELKIRFNKVFWDKKLGTYVIALDKNNKPCRVKSSNAGHTLFSRIAEPKYAKIISENLMSDEMYSGWGIRTLGINAARYNPMSYHNGTVWPHDNALIAMGLSKYGYPDKAVRILQGFFQATFHIDLQRLPELFCGFDKTEGEGPVRYPVACSPQAWSVAVVFMLLQSCLSMEIDSLSKKIFFRNPVLPDFLTNLSIDNLKIDGSTVSIRFQKHFSDVGITVMGKKADWEVIVVK